LEESGIPLSYRDTVLSDTVTAQYSWRRDTIVKGIHVLLAFAMLNIVFYDFSFFINDRLDWQILLFLNPDSPIPLIDDFMVLVTDFSMPIFGAALLFWETAYLLSKHPSITKRGAETFLKILGIILFPPVCTLSFWGGYVHRFIFFPLAILVVITFWSLGNTLSRCDEKTLHHFSLLFWIIILSALSTQLSVEIIKDMVARPRPLSGFYPGYDHGLRIIADEVVRSGYSYPSSHSAMFFAILTPVIFFVSNKRIRLSLFSWGLLHALSRVYLAAHFPYGSLMGAALGFFTGTLMARIFKPAENGKLPRAWSTILGDSSESH